MARDARLVTSKKRSPQLRSHRGCTRCIALSAALTGRVLNTTAATSAHRNRRASTRFGARFFDRTHAHSPAAFAARWHRP